MPTRTDSSAGVGRGAAVATVPAAPAVMKSKGVAASKEGPSRPKGQSVKSSSGKAAPLAARKDAPIKDSVETRHQAILAAIKTPSLCSSATTEALLLSLGVSAGQLKLKISDPLGDIGHRKRNVPASVAVVSHKGARMPNGTAPALFTNALDASSFDAKKIHFAKLVVNGVIQSLNEVIDLGWKAHSSTPAVSDGSTSSRTSATPTTTSNSSRSGSAASSSRTKLDASSASSQRTKAAPPVVETNVRSIFRCAQIAVHYLCEAQRLSCLKASKELELESIMSSIVRKVMAMEMYEAAYEELVWLHSSIVRTYSEEHGMVAYAFPIPTTTLSSRAKENLLEVQALALNSTLATTDMAGLEAVLRMTMKDMGGPLAWQQYLRGLGTSEEEGDKEAADKHAYSIERILSKLIAKHTRNPSEMDPLLALECRKYSLFMLLHVSDLDSEAFWDRAARVGSNYYRSRIANDAASSPEKKNAFTTIDGLFRELHQRAEQVRYNVSLSSSNADEELQSKGFARFCETWMQLAKRAGEGHAIHHIVGLLEGRAKSDTAGSAKFSAREIEVAVVQTCATLSKTIVALDHLLSDEHPIRTDFNSAEADIDSAMQVTRVVSDDGLRKIVKVLDQLRRRAMKVTEEKKGPPPGLANLLLAISRHYEAYLETDVPGQLEDDSVILDDYLCILRSLANATFSVSDWTTHEAAATYLNKCHNILNSQLGRMKEVDGITRGSKWRLVSSSWYFIGGQLYNEKKLSLAVRFLKCACESAQHSLDIFKAAAKAQKEGLSPVERVENVAKKWEHLAVSYRYTNQYEAAYEAYVHGLQSVDESVWSAISQRCRSVPIYDLFPERSSQDSLEKKIGEVASMAKAAFEVAIFDLLSVDAWTDGKSFVPVLLKEEVPREAVAALLEHCLLSHDHTMHKEEAPKAATFLIDTLLWLYTAQESPVRRARVLIRKLELAALQPQVFAGRDGELASTEKECRELLGMGEYHLDCQLAAYVPQYQGCLCLSLVLLEQQRPYTLSTSRMADLVEDAIMWMKRLPRSALPVSTGEATPVATRIVNTGKEPLLARPPPAQVTRPSTSKARPNRATTTSNVAATEAGLLVLDNPVRFCRLLELTVEALQACGYILPLVKLLSASTKMTNALADNAEEQTSFVSSLMKVQMRLGLMSEAGRLADWLATSVNAKDFSRSVKARCLFLIAQNYSLNGRAQDSRDTYKTAVSIASQIGLEERVSSLQQGVNRCLIVERQALAAETYGMIEAADGHPTSALRFAVLSLRSVIKATFQLSRLTVASVEKEASHSPFAQSGSDAETHPAASASPPPTAQDKAVQKAGPRISSWAVGILHWRLTNTLVESYLHTAHLYCVRGSARDAEAFLGEAIDFAGGVNIPLTLAQAYLQRSVLLAKMRLEEKSTQDLQKALVFVEEGATSREALRCAMVRAEQQERARDLPGALQQLQAAEQIHSALSRQICEAVSSPQVQVRSSKSSPRKKAAAPDPQESAFGNLKRGIRQQQARIQQQYPTHRSECELSRGTEKEEDDVEEARQELYKSLEKLAVDPIMGMLPESVVSMPMIQSTEAKMARTLAASVKTAASHLTTARIMLEKIVKSESASRMDSLILREACVNLAYATSLSGALCCSRGDVLDAVDALERACSLTLQKEMLEAIDIKLDQRVGISSTCIPGWQSASQSASNSNQNTSSDESSDEGPADDSTIKASIEAMKGRHLQTSQVELPTDWTVVSISLYRERNCLVLTRREGGDSTSPLVFHLSIDRQSRREGEEEDETATSVESVLDELKSIIEESNVATHAAQHLQGMQARKDWWTRRRELDARLKELLGIVETAWLGAFKSVLMPRPRVAPEDFTALRASFDALFQRALFATTSVNNGRDAGPQVLLDQRIFECFSALAFTTYTDEELEDLTHYVMDAYQFHGQPVAVDEVDLDLCVTDLRAILEGFKSKQQAKQGDVMEKDDDRHLFLILDRDTCALPWESIPLLRSQAVCRIPSMAFLQDRLEHTRVMGGAYGRHQIDSTSAKVWCLLNPSQDLTRTQERFLPWLESMQKKGLATTTTMMNKNKHKIKEKGSEEDQLWTSIVNRAPVVDEMAEALQKNDIAIYFGHGGGDQYIRASKLKALSKCAVTMLWGCSSSVLRYLGDFDRSGTPYNYLMANCPSLLGNLWDTTDKELDGISESVLVKMGLKRGEGEKLLKEKERGHLSIAQAVAQSRDACKLPYLTGAACIVYGIPVYYQ